MQTAKSQCVTIATIAACLWHLEHRPCVSPSNSICKVLSHRKLDTHSSDSIKHSRENLKKSTAIHAKVIAPEDVTLYSEEDLPSFLDSSGCEELFVLYPHQHAIPMTELQEAPKRVVVLDGTWVQTRGILRALEQKPVKMTFLTLSHDYSTVYWRYQDRRASCLATIEAIYYMFKEWHCRSHDADSKNAGGPNEPVPCPYDDLLYYFVFFRDLIVSGYKDGLITGRYQWKRKIKDFG